MSYREPQEGEGDSAPPEGGGGVAGHREGFGSVDGSLGADHRSPWILRVHFNAARRLSAWEGVVGRPAASRAPDGVAWQGRQARLRIDGHPILRQSLVNYPLTALIGSLGTPIRS